MKISTKGRYGLVIMIYLAREYNTGRFVSLKEISESEEISLKYLEKIMLNFKNTDYFISSRGSEGGYKLAHSPKKYNLKDVFEKLEGNIEIVSCLNEGVPCLKKNRCVSRILWKDINNLINDYLSTKTLEDLIKR